MNKQPIRRKAVFAGFMVGLMTSYGLQFIVTTTYLVMIFDTFASLEEFLVGYEEKMVRFVSSTLARTLSMVAGSIADIAAGFTAAAIGRARGYAHAFWTGLFLTLFLSLSLLPIFLNPGDIYGQSLRDAASSFQLTILPLAMTIPLTLVGGWLHVISRSGNDDDDD